METGARIRSNTTKASLDKQLLSAVSKQDLSASKYV
ncbi:unnamed protein product, partial [marine sediment metagenome]